MRRGIFKRIFILYAIIMLLAIFFIELYITDAVRENYTDNLKENLSIQATLISSSIPFQSPFPLDTLCRRLKEASGARVTVIAPNGKVIGDSDKESTLMDNHADRIEIQQASMSGTGMAIRYSDTLHYDFLYVARKVMAGAKPQGFIRMSVPLRGVDTAINRLRIRIIIVVTLMLLATGMFSAWQMGRLRRLTQQIRDFSVSLARGELGKKLFLGHAGEFDEIAGSLNTMSVELRRGIAETEEEKERLNVILKNIPDALLISDAQDIIQISSLAARKVFGVAPMRGKRFIEVVRNQEFVTLVEKVRKSLAPGVAEFKLDYPEERHVVAMVSPLSYRAGELSGFVAIFHDVTRLKALERVRKDFVANVSHELKTPLSAIQGFAETLMEGALDDRKEAEKFIEIIHNHSARLHRLVEDIMTLSRIELGEIRFHLKPMDIQRGIENSVALVSRRTELQKIKLSLEVEPALPLAHADPDRITQVLVNILDNAVKFTPEGGSVWVRARIAPRDEGGVTRDDKSSVVQASEASGRPSSIEISVEDTGPGIPPLLIPRLGERFYRVDPARSRELGGTGLGLAIVKHILHAHGSSLTIKNAQRHGTIVSFCLPIVREETASSQSSSVKL
jgi:two-component system phosphate regulon sensor histidine kinase PhoR